MSAIEEPKEKRRALGRGLDSLLPSGPRAVAPAAPAIMVLDPEQHPPAERAGEAPHPHGIGDVAQMEIAVGAGREAKCR